MINSILLNLKIISEPIDIMYTPLIVVIGLIFTWLPFMVLPIYASLEGLNQSLLEASLDLGASPLERFLTIILPLTKGGIFAGTILVFIPSLGEWLIPALLGGAKIMMAGNLVTLHFITAGNIPAGSSIAAVLTAIIILIIYLFTKLGGEEALERIV
jgi:spermidine/putrescine transport system permease protein